MNLLVYLLNIPILKLLILYWSVKWYRFIAFCLTNSNRWLNGTSHQHLFPPIYLFKPFLQGLIWIYHRIISKFQLWSCNRLLRVHIFLFRLKVSVHKIFLERGSSTIEGVKNNFKIIFHEIWKLNWLWWNVWRTFGRLDNYSIAHIIDNSCNGRKGPSAFGELIKIFSKQQIM